MSDTNGHTHDDAIVVRREEVAISALGTAPNEVIGNAVTIANSLAQIVERAKLATNISGKRYVMAEGWTTLGAMLSVFPQVEWTKRVELSNGAYAWESRVQLVKSDGRLIASAEAMAASNEGAKWCGKEYSVRSMAQTRATGKAFRLAFSWIMTLAGFEPTPAEEMPAEVKATKSRVAGRSKAAAAPAADMEVAAPAVVVDEAEVDRRAALRGLRNILRRLNEAVPSAMPFFIDDPSDKARDARLAICSQFLGQDVKDTADLTASQARHITRGITEAYPDVIERGR